MKKVITKFLKLIGVGTGAFYLYAFATMMIVGESTMSFALTMMILLSFQVILCSIVYLLKD